MAGTPQVVAGQILLNHNTNTDKRLASCLARHARTSNHATSKELTNDALFWTLRPGTTLQRRTVHAMMARPMCLDGSHRRVGIDVARTGTVA